MFAIEAKSLFVSFGNRKVLSELNVGVNGGTVCALLGPNGAGKTTLIKTLVNIYRADSGSSSILGIPSNQLQAKDFTRIGYVSESQELPLWMTVRKFLNFCRRLYPNWNKAKEQEMLKNFDLKNSLNAPLRTLSRGMRVKTSLVSSLAFNPELLILDEPFSGLDPIVREDFIGAIIQLASDIGSTTLISSHDLEEVEQLADSIAILHNGKIISHKTLDQLFNSYKMVTLDFPGLDIGSMRYPSTWRNPTAYGSSLRFLDTNYSKENILETVKQLSNQISVSAVEDVPLKEIFRAIINGQSSTRE